ncbi:MAG TPA: hypothetical protein QGH10_10745, partial [Armatimonadota bacterium]|nr:hypothetical protein [Armatimonadota bacterium]
VYPWYERIFSAIHACGRKAVYMSDGYYVEALPDLLACGPDGFMIESSSMDPAEFCPRAGADKLFLIKTHNQNMDFGTPGDIEAELRKLGDLHEDFPGMMIYRGGGNPPPENARAFTELYEELLVY